MAKKFCCCGSNLTAAKILSAIFIIVRIVQLGLAGFLIANWQFVEDNLVETEGQDQDAIQDAVDQIELMLKVSLGLNAVFLAGDLGLLVGSISKIQVLLWIWLIGAALSVIYMIISNVFLFNVLTIIGTVIYALVSFWVMCAVYGGIQEIKEEKQAEANFNENHAKNS